MEQRMRYSVRKAGVVDEPRLVELFARFRVALAEMRGKEPRRDLAAAKEELAGTLGRGYPVFVAMDEAGDLVGYLVCRVDGSVVWAESLYVEPPSRRKGVGSLLYTQAEVLAQELGGDWPYNWVDPENGAIIRFLGRRGYDVLNLLELRKPRPGEDLGTVRVGTQRFRR